MPSESSVTVRKFLTCRLRSRSISGSSVRPLHAAVPAAVVVRAVAIVLPVRLVVLAIVGHEVVEGEAVVAGDEVDALLGLALLVPVDLGAADQPVRDPRHRARLAAEEVADVVAEPAVPLLPAVADEAADLVETRRVPRLGNELRARERRIRLDVPQHRRVRQRLTRRHRAPGSRRDRTGSRRRASPPPSSAGCPRSSGGRSDDWRSACSRCRCSWRSARGRSRGCSMRCCPARGSTASARAHRPPRCG